MAVFCKKKVFDALWYRAGLRRRSNLADQTAKLLQELPYDYEPKKRLNLVDLSVELLLLIYDELPLASTYMLRQTCFRMSSILSRGRMRWKRRVVWIDRLPFLAGIADIQADRMLCGICYRLHDIKLEDVPRESIRHQSHHTGNCKGDHQLSYTYGPGYRLEFHHIHLALKYTRMGNTHRQYLADLMASHSHYRAFHYVSESYFAEPKVIDGQFFLRSSWTLGPQPGYTLFSSRAECEIAICPHMEIWRPRCRGRSNILLHRQVYLWLKQPNWPGSQRYYSCSHCTTDYALLVTPAEMFFQVWQAFGAPQSPLDTTWRVHLRQRDSLARPSLTLNHVPGSIRSGFEEN
jgi:hypothetical protein